MKPSSFVRILLIWYDKYHIMQISYPNSYDIDMALGQYWNTEYLDLRPEILLEHRNDFVNARLWFNGLNAVTKSEFLERVQECMYLN